jgi:PAS domain S-box-containing protein
MPERPDMLPAAELMALLLAQSRDYAIFFFTPANIVCDWYPGAEHVFGYASHEMVGRSVSVLFHPEDLKRGADRYETELAARIGRSEDDRWHIRKDGSAFWGSGVTIALRDPRGEVVAFAKLVRNRTDVKSQTESLERERDALARRDEQSRTFLGILGHELRNPLAPMANALYLIQQAGGGAPVMQQAVRVLERQMAVITRLVDDIMDVTRLASGKVDLKRSIIDLREIAAGVVEAARPQASSRSQSLSLVMIDSPIRIDGDADRLHQVLINLVNNAIKYTPVGGSINVNLATEGGDAVVRVEDDGIGMDAAVLPSIFELFTQENASREASGGGLGLGLPLVRELVRAHGGTVQARSDGRGKGSVFTVRLPLKDASQP